MSYSGHHNPYQSQATPPNYNPHGYGTGPPQGYHTSPGHNPAAPPMGGGGHHQHSYTAYRPAAPPTGYAPPGGAYHAAPPPSYAHGPPPTGYGAPAGYGHHQSTQHPHYGAPPAAKSSYPPPASNPYATAHSGAPGYAPVEPPQPLCPPGVDPTLWQVFKVVDSNNSNSITANELQQALTNNNWTQFNSETCRLLIGQFDQNKDGSIDIYEFSHLWKYIQEWRQCFEGFDADGSGTIDVNELQQAFQTFGYRLSIDFCRLCTRVFDRSDIHSMNFDSFIQCCVLMRSLTDSFRRRDTNLNGQIDVSYEDFLEMVIDNTVTN